MRHKGINSTNNKCKGDIKTRKHAVNVFLSLILRMLLQRYRSPHNGH